MTTLVLKQGATLIATHDFGLRKARASKVCWIKTGDRFWVTTSTLSNSRGTACIDREGRGQISLGYAMEIDNILANFRVEV